MARKQFNISEFISNEVTPVETRDHCAVRIICIDRINNLEMYYDKPIVALKMNEYNHEFVYSYSKDGKYDVGANKNENDLFFKSKRWRAETNGRFYYITDCMVIEAAIDYKGIAHNNLYSCGNYFKTYDEAKEVLELIKNQTNNHYGK